MPLRRRYSIGSLLVATAIVAVVLGVLVPVGLFGPLLQSALAGMPLVKAYGPLAVYGPGVVAIVVLICLGVGKPRLLLGTIAGVLAAVISMASPQLCAWYVWRIQNDHTANIGAGLLYMAQPVLAPALALTAFVAAKVIAAAVWTSSPEESQSPAGSADQGDWRPPLPPAE